MSVSTRLPRCVHLTQLWRRRAEAPQRFSGDFGRCAGLPLVRAAGQRSTGAGGRVTSLKYITAATRSVLAAAGADGALVLIAADPARRPHSKYVPPGAELARRRGAAEGGAGRVCAVGTPRPRTLRRGGAPAALAHRHRRRGRAALRPLPVRRLRCAVWWHARRRRQVRGGQGSTTASWTLSEAGSGLAGSRSESSTRAAARPSASAGSWLLPAGRKRRWEVSADCARTAPLFGGLLVSSGRPSRPAATAGGLLHRAGSTPASVDASGAPFSSCARGPAGSPRDIFLPQAKTARSQRLTPPAQGRLPPPSAQPSAPVSRSERVL